MSILHTFVALDLETTGLKPESGEIVEIGAVKVEGGAVVDRFQTYVKPRNGIPEKTAGLTGITAKDVRRAPRVENALESFLDFTGGLPIVAHHGRFETRFISAFLGLPYEGTVHSLRDLARTALPSLPDHSPGGLAATFKVEADGPHKAQKDAEILAAVYQATVEELRNTPLRLKQQMLQLLKDTRSDLLPILVDLANEGARKEFMSQRAGGGVSGEDFRAMFNLGGEETRTSSGGERPLDVAAIQAMFEPGGCFEKGHKGYEFRPEQIEMARSVAEAFNGACFLAVEAGTGVGKSMAYLAPAALYAVQNNARVIVSTNTKNLQEQLFFKDLPDLEAALDLPFQYALLKGRGNYICLNRWDAALTNLDNVFTEEERIGALPLVVWADRTETGDIAENTGFDMARYAGLWAKVCSDSGFCRSQRCRNNGRCLANVIRKAAQKAHVVVVNHSLLFSDLASENGILGEYQHLILDEAHNVEKIAAHYLGRELNIWRIKNLTDRLRSSGFVSTGTLPALRHWLSVSDLDADVLKPFDTGIGAAIEAAEALWLKTQSFFESLTDHTAQQSGGRRNTYTEKLRYRPGEPTFDGLQDDLQPFAEAAAGLGGRLQNLTDWLRDLREDAFPNQDEIRSELEGRVEECHEILEDIDHLTAPSDPTSVYWMELPGREGSMDTRLLSAPLNVSEALQETLYGQKEVIVFTSATLGIRGKLIYFLRRMGLDAMPQDRVRTLCLGSPFNYETQALVCAAQFMPSPKSPAFQEAVDKLLCSIAVKVRRGTLALFTSYSMLNRTYNAIKPDLQAESILLLGQGIDGSRANITDRFRLDKQAILLGTDSFWEGVDIPGEALQILGIVRLPFAVPSEPLVAAQMEELEKQGKDSFLHYSVPEAILKFRQGFGRLIRNKTDRGVVLVLDSRVLSTRYGRVFLEALPVACRTFQASQDLVETIRTWFDGAADNA